MTKVTAGQIIKTFEKWAPKSFAYDWDNVGLQVGSLNKPVENVMVTLDVVESVVDEAVEKKVDLIIAHHPLLFVKLHQINVDTPKGRVVQKLIKHDITVYAAHTNLDVAEGGVNDVMADLLEVKDRRPLIPTETEKLVKLAVFVPDSHLEVVRDAVSGAGAGFIGDYSHCTYQVSGEGTFKPQEGTNPFIGEQGRLEQVREKRLETIVPQEKLSEVLQAMANAHPYEEAAYDLYPLLNEGRTFGIGRVGQLEEPVSLKDFADKVKERFHVSHVRVAGNMEKTIKTVALLGGSGEKYIHKAKRSGADVYVTGDMTFHMTQDAVEMGLNVIDPGHHVEKVVCAKVQQYLEEHCNENGALKVLLSEVDTEPFAIQ
ncbi:Nif3-like dinuclear metal center hexameric protein [Halobacillus litoralis]|uniref:GTP cyclohydrolase 1 type 2 homolog n=1 Tax=Halobacillus litoralis TaxID=45668 RepID=A0A845DRK4_9BACI|nr:MULTISPECIES: Nif3-like dinuclear metal center hexameric protein [Halobacillus]MYL19798.1 Nif3-like dinuclear metal center hexameric protein [Halobacillus litoralis]MYL28944.1 Nif3-like dinuclear metal center hexameric protein [Halobacillus halophilus]